MTAFPVPKEAYEELQSGDYVCAICGDMMFGYDQLCLHFEVWHQGLLKHQQLEQTWLFAINE